MPGGRKAVLRIQPSMILTVSLLCNRTKMTAQIRHFDVRTPAFSSICQTCRWHTAWHVRHASHMLLIQRHIILCLWRRTTGACTLHNVRLGALSPILPCLKCSPKACVCCLWPPHGRHCGPWVSEMCALCSQHPYNAVQVIVGASRVAPSA